MSLVPLAGVSKREPRNGGVDGELELARSMSAAPVDGRAGLNFSIGKTRYSLCDQGCMLKQGRGSMGLGIKLTSSRFAAAVEPVTRAAPLPFNIVAVVRNPARVNEALQRCKQLCLGGARGYGLLQPHANLVLVYDVATSLAWYVNQPPPGMKPTAKLCIDPQNPWRACVRPHTKLCAGEHILMRYGTGSSHHKVVRDEMLARRERAPAVNARKAKMKARMLELSELRRKGVRCSVD